MIVWQATVHRGHEELDTAEQLPLPVKVNFSGIPERERDCLKSYKIIFVRNYILYTHIIHLSLIHTMKAKQKHGKLLPEMQVKSIVLKLYIERL